MKIKKRLNLKIQRMRVNLSQAQLAKKVGITKQSISDYETGRINPSFEVMAKIAKELDSTVDELFFKDIE
ncbi:MAG: helix-turn-helix transcriptional regulator [Tissierellales bacterium]|jgi:putative transcriptional regulator|nr:helix-turn-helix transcriptional regulator [Tissierellales bacterium]